MADFGLGFGIGMLRKRDAGEETVWAQLPASQSDVTLADGDKLVNLQAAIQAKPLLTTITIAQMNADQAYRLLDRSGDAYESFNLTPSATELYIPAAGSPLAHTYGESIQTIWNEMTASKAWLEANLTGCEVKSFAWPEHKHDRVSMRMLAQAGYICARNGTIGYTPTGSVIGTNTPSLADVKIIQTWALWPRFQMPLQAYFDVVNVTGKTKAQIYDMLYDTANHQTSPSASQLFGYGSLMEAWKAEHTWVQFYAHDTTEVDNAAFGYLLEILSEDADIWAERMSVIGDYAAARHANYGPSQNDEFVYEPDVDYGATPWNGHAMAVTVSLDDPRADAYDYFYPTSVAKGVPLTIFVALLFVVEYGGSYVTKAELQTMLNGGMEIAAHGVNHYLMVDEQAVLIKDSAAGTCKRAVTVVESAPNLILRFHRDAGEAYPWVMNAALRRWWDPTALGLANGALVTSVPDLVAGDTAANAASTVTYLTNLQNSLGGLNFTGVVGTDYLEAGYGNLHSATLGFMFFVVAKWASSDTRAIFTKYDTAGGGHYYWRLQVGYAQIFEVHTAALPAQIHWNPSPYTLWPASTLAVVCMTWTPGGGVKVFVNGVDSALEGDAVASIDLDMGGDWKIQIGNQRAGHDLPLIGSIGDIIPVALYDATILSEMTDYLKTRWAIA